MLIAGIVLQGTLRLGVLAWYEYNKSYIAKNLCENRDKPQMKCCGKCYLHKQLNKAGDDDTNKNNPRKTDKTEHTYFIVAQRAYLPVSAASHYTVYHTPFKEVHFHSRFIGSVFRPPSAAC